MSRNQSTDNRVKFSSASFRNQTQQKMRPPSTEERILADVTRQLSRISNPYYAHSRAKSVEQARKLGNQDTAREGISEYKLRKKMDECEDKGELEEQIDNLNQLRRENSDDEVDTEVAQLHLGDTQFYVQPLSHDVGNNRVVEEQPAEQDVIDNMGVLNANQLEELLHGQTIVLRRSRAKRLAHVFITMNVVRLFLGRSLQEVDSIQVLFPEPVKVSLSVAGHMLGMLGWIIYGFRLVRNIGCGLKNWYNTGSVDYFRQHKHEFVNDVAWIARGVICFGVATKLYLMTASKSLGPAGILLTLIVYALDMINAAWKYCDNIKNIDLSRRMLQEEISFYEGRKNEMYQQMLNEHTNGVQLPAYTDDESDSVDQKSIIQILIDLAEKKKLGRWQLCSDYINHQQLVKLALADKTLLSDKQRAFLSAYSQLPQTIAYAKNCVKRLPSLRKYAHILGRVNVGIAGGYLLACGIIALLIMTTTGPIGIAAGATVMLAMCGVEYYLKRKYLPRKQIELEYNAAELLHEKLVHHVVSQLEHLQKSNLRRSVYGQDRTDEKIKAYETAFKVLSKWQKTRDYSQLHELVTTVGNASMICRYFKKEPRSAKRFKKELEPFISAKWHQTDRKVTFVCRDRCIAALKPFMRPWKKRVHSNPSVLFTRTKEEHRKIRKNNKLVLARYGYACSL